MNILAQTKPNYGTNSSVEVDPHEECTDEYMLKGKYSVLYSQTLQDGHIYNPRIDRRSLVMQMLVHAREYCGFPYACFSGEINKFTDQKYFYMDVMAFGGNPEYCGKHNERGWNERRCRKVSESAEMMRKRVYPIIRTAITLLRDWDNLATVYTSGPLYDLFSSKTRKTDLAQWLDDVVLCNREGHNYTFHFSEWPDDMQILAGRWWSYAAEYQKTALYHNHYYGYKASYDMWHPSFAKLIDFMCTYCRYLVMLNLINYWGHWSVWFDDCARYPKYTAEGRRHRAAAANRPVKSIIEDCVNGCKTWEDVELRVSGRQGALILGC